MVAVIGDSGIFYPWLFHFSISPFKFPAALQLKVLVISCVLTHPVRGGIYPLASKAAKRTNRLTDTFIVLPVVTMGDDLQPGCLADRLLNGLGPPQINP